MERTVFSIKDMDCPSEEQMVRMKLADNAAVKQLSFDLDNRQLTILHEGGLEGIAQAIGSLRFGEKIIEAGVYSGDISLEESTADKKLLITVLIINFSVFVIEITAGLLSNSMGLVADSLDELADAFVYALGIYAISGTLIVKKRIARSSGVLQLLLAAWGFFEIVRRFLGEESVPNFTLMIVFSLIAIAGNIASLYFLRKSRSQEVHIKATQIFTSNDIFVNFGVILAAILVAVLQSRIPDLVIGAIVLAIVVGGAIRIFKLAR